MTLHSYQALHDSPEMPADDEYTAPATMESQQDSETAFVGNVAANTAEPTHDATTAAIMALLQTTTVAERQRSGSV